MTSAGGRGGGEGVDTCANSPVITGELEGMREKGFRAQQLCESRGGRPGLPVPNKPYGFCGREATLNWKEKLRPVLSADWFGCLMN